MKIFDKSIELAKELYIPHSTKEHPYFLFSFIYRRNTLLSIGQNSYKINSKAMKFGKSYSIPEFIKYPYNHSEIDAISRLIGRVYMDSSLKMVNVRLRRDGSIGCSKPCDKCNKVIRAFGLRVYYSNELGDFINE
jgi:hypothetical protein